VTALWRRYAGERDTQQILDIGRKGGAAADHTTVIIYSLLCHRADLSIYGMNDSAGSSYQNDGLCSRFLRSVLTCFGSCVSPMTFDPHSHYHGHSRSNSIIVLQDACSSLLPYSLRIALLLGIIAHAVPKIKANHAEPRSAARGTRLKQ